MIKNILCFLALVALLFSTYFYVYNQGLYDGEANYKKSKHMALALESAYNYGFEDGKGLTKQQGIYHITCPQGVIFSFTANAKGVIHNLNIEGLGSGQCKMWNTGG